METVTPALTQIGSILDGVGIEIGKVMGNREEEFLVLGSDLQEFTRIVAGLTAQASRLSELASGEEIDLGVNDLSAELERMHDLTGLDSSGQSLSELDSILEVSRALSSLTQDFRRIVKKLQMLGISTRIESARLGSLGRGFTTLADDVDKLAQNIVVHSTQILDKNKILADLVGSVRDRTNSILQTQQECSRDVFSCIEGNLRSLLEMSHRSQDVSAKLPDKARGISRDIGEVVASLQFHDIVRQQVEHVLEALDESRSLLTPLLDTEMLDQEGKDVVGWLADVCSLQASQLRNASETFGAAVERLRGHMRGITHHVDELGRALSDTVSEGNAGGGTVLARIEQSVSRVADSMLEYAGQGEIIGKIMGDVAGTISQMAAFVSDIEDVGAEIELIALNASVKAAHTGEEGKALGVLAQSIQHLSVEARSQTEAVSSVLTRISQTSETLLRDADKHLDHGQVDAMISRLRKLTGSLRGISDRIETDLSAMGATMDDLARSIEATVAGITFHHDLRRGLDNSRAQLEQAGRMARGLVPHGDDLGRSERLKAMLDRYTMDAERVIHMNAFGGETGKDGNLAERAPGGPDAGEHPKTSAGSAEDDELGDNVELF